MASKYYEVNLLSNILHDDRESKKIKGHEN